MKKLLLPITAVLFDLDDTLNDRAASWRSFIPRFQDAYATRLVNCDATMIERAIAAADHGGYREKQDFFSDLCRTLPWNAVPLPSDLEKFWRSCFANCMVERAGAVQLLADLRQYGFRLGIVSNGRAEMQRAKIARLGMDSLVQTVVISEEIGIRKPDARIFRLALDRLECEAESSLMVGDHPAFDVAGADNAGMRVAWLSLGRIWPANSKEPDFQLQHLDDLRSILGLEK